LKVNKAPLLQAVPFLLSLMKGFLEGFRRLKESSDSMTFLYGNTEFSFTIKRNKIL